MSDNSDDRRMRGDPSSKDAEQPEMKVVQVQVHTEEPKMREVKVAVVRVEEPETMTVRVVVLDEPYESHLARQRPRRHEIHSRLTETELVALVRAAERIHGGEITGFTVAMRDDEIFVRDAVR